MREVAITFVTALLASAILLGIAFFIRDERTTASVPTVCEVQSHSFNERIDDGSWMFDSKTVYTGDCGVAILGGDR